MKSAFVKSTDVRLVKSEEYGFSNREGQLAIAPIYHGVAARWGPQTADLGTGSQVYREARYRDLSDLDWRPFVMRIGK